MVNVKEKLNEIQEENEGILERAADWSDGLITDIIAEIADDYVDLYMDDKIEWAKEHIEEIDNVLEDGNYKDFGDLLSDAEFYYYMDILNNNIEDFVKIAILAHLNEEEITEEKMEKIEEIAETANGSDRLEWLIEEAEAEEEEEG